MWIKNCIDIFVGLLDIVTLDWIEMLKQGRLHAVTTAICDADILNSFVV